MQREGLFARQDELLQGVSGEAGKDGNQINVTSRILKENEVGNPLVSVRKSNCPGYV